MVKRTTCLLLLCGSLFLIPGPTSYSAMNSPAAPRGPNVTALNTVLVATDTVTSTQTVTSEELLRIPIDRTIEGILKIKPATKSIIYIPGTDTPLRTSGLSVIERQEFAAFIIQTMLKDQAPSPAKYFLCDGRDPIDCERIQTLPSNISSGVAYGSNGIDSVVDIITRSGSTKEVNTGWYFNPVTGRAGPRFPFFTPPEQTFPKGIISSAGVSDDLSISFQFLNFLRDDGSYYSWMLFRKLNQDGKPFGQACQFPYFLNYNNYYIDSGSITNSIKTGNGPRYFITFRQFDKVNTPDMKSQVVLLPLDGNTMNPIPPRIFYSDWSESVFPFLDMGQSVAIDPNGAYVAFSDVPSTCDRDLLWLRRMNSETGRPSSGPRSLRGCAEAAGTEFGWGNIDAYDFYR